jgi:predicted dinucleotide-binding enzyme
VNARVMVDPGQVPGEHDVFICGDDEAAKSEVVELLEGFGWPRDRVVNLGGIDGARAVEMYLPLWLRLFGAFGTSDVNIHVAH